MPSLTVLAFIGASILLGLFGGTFSFLIGKSLGNLRYFGFSFICLAVAFLIWAIATFFKNSQFLNLAIFIGDILLFFAAFFLSLIEGGLIKRVRLTALAAVTIIFFGLRLFIY